MTERQHPCFRAALAVAFALALVLSACGGDDGSDDDRASATTADEQADGTTATTIDRPDGAAAEISELTGGNGVFVGSPTPYEPEAGYVQEEYAAAGTASSYQLVGEQTPDGMWTVEPGKTADYKTRVIVRRPEQPEDFSGIVVLEWMNVSGGVDADVEWNSLREEIVRQGHAWVGVSAQAIGIEGGPVLVRVDAEGSEAAGKGLKTIDPERYGSLSHPSDAYANDIFTQVGQAVREGALLPDLDVSYMIAGGESQSAFALVTYINGIQPLTGMFDGFFVHSRGATAFPFPAEGESVDLAGALSRPPTTFRTDLGVPVMDVQAENDVAGILASNTARQPDSDTFRLWEMAGTAHADTRLVGTANAENMDCGAPINDGPMNLIAKAAFRHLVTWVETGEPPPEAARLELADSADPALVRDEDGIASGGVRTPPVEVPTRVLSGQSDPTGEIICILSGWTKPIPSERLAELYSSREEFEQQYGEALDEAIDAGFVLEEDREAFEDLAHPELVAE